MKGYRLTETADQHLQDIWSYTRERWGAKQADVYLQQLQDGLVAAMQTTALWRPRPELGEGVLADKVGAHILFGRVADEWLHILAVLHERMEPRRGCSCPEPGRGNSGSLGCPGPHWPPFRP